MWENNLRLSYDVPMIYVNLTVTVIIVYEKIRRHYFRAATHTHTYLGVRQDYRSYNCVCLMMMKEDH